MKTKIINNVECIKCGSGLVFGKEVKPHYGIYCNNCGGFIKWASKNERTLLERTPLAKALDDIVSLDLKPGRVVELEPEESEIDLIHKKVDWIMRVLFTTTIPEHWAESSTRNRLQDLINEARGILVK